MLNAIQSTDQTFDFVAYAAERRKLIEEKLDQYLTPKEPLKLWEAMRYSVLSGGKRLRALLCLATAEAIYLTNNQTSSYEAILPCCCAIEMVHAMSLIHDDLPAMDNDDFRRGKPTNHKVFGEAIALLAGDALLVLANEILINKTSLKVDPQILLSVVSELSSAIGPNGMVGGQIYDLLFTGAADNRYPVDIETVETIHKYKTGALIRFSAWSGAKLAGADKNQLHWVDQYTEIIGLAFQIADDILDCTSDLNALGKTPGKDQATNKTTWVSLCGLKGAQAKLAELEVNGLKLLDNSGLALQSRPALQAILQYAIHRTN